MAPLSIRYVLYNCKEAIRGLSLSLPNSFPQLTTLLISFILFIGFLHLAYQLYKTHTYIRKILKNKVLTSQKVKKIAYQLGIQSQIIVVYDKSFSSFCYGYFSPQICLSKQLVNELTIGELKAVLIHEQYHLRNRDPLKVLLSQVAVSMFFFAPILRDLNKSYILSKELAADQLVIQTKLAKDLKSALSKTLNTLNPNLIGVSSFASESSLEQRIEVLAYAKTINSVRLSKFNLFVTSIMLTLAWLILSLPVSAMENKDGTHSYLVLPVNNSQLMYCETENVFTTLPFSSQNLFSPTNNFRNL